MTRRRYTDEFKREAVALVASGPSVEQVATQLGIPPGTLWNWVQPHGQAASATGAAAAGQGESAPYRAALKRIAELERENEFLGKASAYFAQQVHR